MDFRVVFLLALEACFALFLLYRAGMFFSRPVAVSCVLLTVSAFMLRLACFNYETLDYVDFLSKWVEFYRSFGGFAGLAHSVGNYNIPYLYFLALFSYLPVNDLYLIKLLTVFFDVLLAYASMQLLRCAGVGRVPRLACFFVVLFLPTVVLNGALWGQCDSIYVSLAVMSIYHALDGRPIRSMVCMALSFGFKLQAVFVMPVLAVLWMYRKYSLRHFLVFPAAYVLLVLPAVLLGRPFADTLTLYFNQTGSIGSGLNYNSSSVYALFSRVSNEPLAARLGIAAAFAAMLALLILCFARRRDLNAKAVLAAALLFSLVIPFLLPHMHERYFFAADIMALLAAFTAPVLFAAPLLTQFASLLGYHAYLKMRYLLPMRFGALSLIAVILMSLCFLFACFQEEKTRREEAP